MWRQNVYYFSLRWLRSYGIINKLREWQHLGQNYVIPNPPPGDPEPLQLLQLAGIFLVWIVAFFVYVVILIFQMKMDLNSRFGSLDLDAETASSQEQSKTINTELAANPAIELRDEQ